MNCIPVIGLEIHAELLTKTKIFCSCKNEFGKETNTLVCPICSGMPGSLPVLNKKAVELAIKSGLVLDCKINNNSSFDRKNYFYPDLPKGYQITQFYHPICENGYVMINDKKIEIERIHLEEDAGKLIHCDDSSLIDYNRCGVPLIEIVTKPDFRSSTDVCDFIREISLRLKYADICDAKLEQGSLRVDINISVMEENSSIFGTRAEIKNLNSIKAIAQAIEYEIKRQSDLILNGEKVKLETRRFDENSEKTISMRTKESVSDYRYFPEPDLPSLHVTDEEISYLKKQLPEMPQQRLSRYINVYNLSYDEAQLIINRKTISDFYDTAVLLYPSYKTIANIILIEINRNLNQKDITFENIPFKPDAVSEIAKLYDDKKISKNALCEIIKLMFENDKKPYDIAVSNNLLMQDNTEDIDSSVKKIISENKQAVNEYNNGNNKAFTFLMGQVMRKAGKGTNPNTVTKLLKQNLSTFLSN